jgi:hypothetical protein
MPQCSDLLDPLAAKAKPSCSAMKSSASVPSSVRVPNCSVQRFFPRKRLVRRHWRAAQFEIELHFGRGAAVAPGPQMLDRARAVTLEEGGAYRRHQRALAGFVRSGEQIEAVAEIAQFEGLAEAAELVDAQPGELHCATPSRRAPSSPASSTSASRAVSQSVPSWAARSSATTSPR